MSSLELADISAMKFLESTDLLKIEDILPFFPDFVVIDDFKQEICKALEDYSAHIEELKSEMDEATASAESIKRDIEGLANRFVTVEATDKCWKCGLVLVTRQFYVFPCQHVFHADCLISMVRLFVLALIPGHGILACTYTPTHTASPKRTHSTPSSLLIIIRTQSHVWVFYDRFPPGGDRPKQAGRSRGQAARTDYT